MGWRSRGPGCERLVRRGKSLIFIAKEWRGHRRALLPRQQNQSHLFQLRCRKWAEEDWSAGLVWMLAAIKKEAVGTERWPDLGEERGQRIHRTR